MSLDSSPAQTLCAAEGYLDPGLFDMAGVELGQLPHDSQTKLEAMAIRLEICRAREDWAGVEKFARELSLRDAGELRWSLELAEAAARLKGPAAAQAALLPVIKRQPRAASLHYHLARYECQLGNYADAKFHAGLAAALDGSLEDHIILEPDFALLWAFESPPNTRELERIRD